MNAHASPIVALCEAVRLPSKTAAQRVQDVHDLADALAVSVDAFTPQQMANHVAAYREAAKRCADYVTEGHHPEAHLTLLALAGQYATKALVFEAALRDRGLA